MPASNSKISRNSDSQSARNSLLQKVKGGSAMHVGKLKLLVDSTRETDLEVCSAVMAYLDSGHIPYPDRELDSQSVLLNCKAASDALQTITFVFQHRRSLNLPESLKLPPPHLPLFLQYRPHIFEWITFFHSQTDCHCEYHHAVSSVFISVLLESGKTLRDAILTSPVHVETILSIWMWQDLFYAGEEMCVDRTDEGPCSTSYLLEAVLHHEDGNAVLDDVLTSSPRKATQFANSIISRIYHIAIGTSGEVARGLPTFKLAYLRELLRLCGLLLKLQVGRRTLLHSCDLIFATTSTLLHLTNRISRNEGGQKNPWYTATQCLSALCSICFIFEPGTVTPLRRTSTALEQGALQITWRCFHNLPIRQKQYNTVLGILGHFMANSAIHLPTLKSFLSARDGANLMDISSLNSLMKRCSILAKLIKEIETCITPLSSLSMTRVQARICDNIDHDSCSQDTSLADPNQLKKCSKCHSVFYCSEQCQRHDWVNFHRQECEPKAETYRRWKELDGGLSSQGRLLALAFIELVAKIKIKFVREATRPYDLTQLDSSPIFVIDRAHIYPELNVVPARHYLETSQVCVPPHHQKRIRAHLSRRDERQMWYFELRIGYGAQWILHTFAKAWEDNDGTFHVRSSVFWRCHRICSPKEPQVNGPQQEAPR